VVLAATTLALTGVLPLREVMAEHRAYLAGFGIALIAAERWPAGVRARAAAALVCATLAGATVHRAWVWADEARLWQDAVDVNPASAPAWRALGDAHRLARRFPEAERAYRTALEREPADTDAQLNLGIVRAEQGGTEEARRLWKGLLKANPRACAAHNNLAALALREGDSLAAIDGWQASLNACPNDLLAHLNLGLLYARVGDAPRAAFHLSAFLERAPREHPQRAAAAAQRARLDLSDEPAAPR
jgi:tetratricopeptide (TPR) repeat protein